MEEEGEKKEVKKADLSQHQVQVVSSLMPLNQETEAIDVRIPSRCPAALQTGPFRPHARAG
jgi:hypothetical protein